MWRSEVARQAREAGIRDHVERAQRGATCGDVVVQTTSSGAGGVSGAVAAETGAACAGDSGAITVATGSATTGSGGDVNLLVGSGDTENGGLW